MLSLDQITRADAADRIEAFANDGRLMQGDFQHTTSDGQQFACLLGAIHPCITSDGACPASIMPPWMARVLVELYDGVHPDKAQDYGRRFAQALRGGVVDASTKAAFMRACVDAAREWFAQMADSQDAENAYHATAEAAGRGDAYLSAMWALQASDNNYSSDNSERMFDALLNAMEGGA